MENTTTTAPKRSRRSQEQWHAILTEHLAAGGTVQELADKLACKASTVEFQLKRVTSPNPTTKPGPRAGSGFVEVSARAATAAPAAVALRLQTATGVTVTFAVLPPPEYLAAALGLAA